MLNTQDDRATYFKLNDIQSHPFFGLTSWELKYNIIYTTEIITLKFELSRLVNISNSYMQILNKKTNTIINISTFP